MQHNHRQCVSITVGCQKTRTLLKYPQRTMELVKRRIIVFSFLFLLKKSKRKKTTKNERKISTMSCFIYFYDIFCILYPVYDNSWQFVMSFLLSFPGCLLWLSIMVGIKGMILLSWVCFLFSILKATLLELYNEIYGHYFFFFRLDSDLILSLQGPGLGIRSRDVFTGLFF